MSKIITMGEMMIRFMPPAHQKFEQASTFEAYYGGDESIVASSLARFGLDVGYITKLPKNAFGDMAVGHLRMNNVNTSAIARGGNRIGINFYENGVSMRPSKVIYDRANSAFADANVDDFDFDEIFEGAEWFHVSGITPALSDKAERFTETAMKVAKKHGVTVSCDLNYRRKLWSPERAKKVMTRLMEYVDVCIGNEEDADITLGFRPSGTDVFNGQLCLDGYYEIFRQMKDKFGFSFIGTTLRESHSASDNGWSVLVYDGKEFCHSRKYEIHLIDRGGGGASFAAGMIYGISTGMDLKNTAEFAAATSALKQTISGDFNLASLDDVLALCGGDVSGRVQR